MKGGPRDGAGRKWGPEEAVGGAKGVPGMGQEGSRVQRRLWGEGRGVPGMGWEGSVVLDGLVAPSLSAAPRRTWGRCQLHCGHWCLS